MSAPVSPALRRRLDSRHHYTAFTLAELLIILGIIALLISLLLPTLAGARETANRTKCLSNLRQLAVAFTMYLNDSGGRFPRPAQLNVPRPEDWVFFQPGRDRDAGALAAYVSRPFIPDIYRCPSDDAQTHPEVTALDGRPTRYAFSYAVNEHICRTVARGNTIRLTQVRNPSMKILLIDESAETLDDGCWAWQPSMGDGRNVLAIRHDSRAEKSQEFALGRGNVAFVDGHAEYIARRASFDRRHFDPFAD